MISRTSVYELLFGKNHPTDGSVIDIAEHGRTGGTTKGEPYKIIGDVPLRINLEEKTDGDGNSITIVGDTRVGAVESDSEWRLRRITEFASNASLTTAVEFAEGNSNYSFVWSSRASLSFS